MKEMINPLGTSNMLSMIGTIVLYIFYLTILQTWVAVIVMASGLGNLAFIAYRWIVMAKDRRKQKQIEKSKADNP